MKSTIVLDKSAEIELNELVDKIKISKSAIIREAITDFYLKEKRAKENLLFFVDLYNKGIITKDLILLLLPRKDAEAIIIGSKTGKEAVDFVKNLSS